MWKWWRIIDFLLDSVFLLRNCLNYLNYIKDHCFDSTSLYVVIWIFQTAIHSGVVRETWTNKTYNIIRILGWIYLFLCIGNLFFMKFFLLLTLTLFKMEREGAKQDYIQSVFHIGWLVWMPKKSSPAHS